MDGRLSPQFGSRHSLNKIHQSPRSSLTVYDRSLGVESPWFKGRSEESRCSVVSQIFASEYVSIRMIHLTYTLICLSFVIL
ncbi:hypothetical protein NPIL_35731 [Nephila pilipes]|uniref:Uncharacterized protein n=1 Tax=Nephila pilipes TaxID=299642 RepID=A0A8X6UR35_NEPPI|nr:hypothetical protein NPIL_35731 [Nephila pilipes]